MMFLIQIFIIIALIGVDLLTKYVVDCNMLLGESISFIPKIINWTYVHNTGAAFSMLEGKMLLFYIMTPIVVIGLLIYLWKLNRDKSTRFEQFCIVAIIAGALGNFYDRVRFECVRDFIEFDFVDFAVFNFADICLTCGAIALIVYLLVAIIKEARHPNKDDQNGQT